MWGGSGACRAEPPTDRVELTASADAQGALAPPVGPDALPSSLLELFSLEDPPLVDSCSLVFSGTALPPEGVALSLDDGVSSPDSLDELSPVVGVVDVGVLDVEVVEVDVVSTASFSAVVLLGGLMSGVRFGVASETLLPPQALRPRPQRSVSALALSAATRGSCEARITPRVGPCADCTSGSR